MSQSGSVQFKAPGARETRGTVGAPGLRRNTRGSGPRKARPVLGLRGHADKYGRVRRLLLMAVPRNMLENMPAELEMLSQVHGRMEAHYRERIDRLSS